MATTITIQTGPLTRQRSWANDAKAQAALLKYAEHAGCDPALSNGQKLEFVIDRLVMVIVSGAEERRAQEISGSAITQARAEVGFED